MRTDNLKKLITATIRVNAYSSSFYREIAPISGSFVQVDGSTTAASRNDYVCPSDIMARTMALSDIMSVMVLRTITSGSTNYAIEYKTWTAVKAMSATPNQPVLNRYISVTYDATDTPIASSDYAMKGTDVSATISLQNNGTVTLTFSNAGSSVLHANRIGISACLIGKPTLLHLIAIDDIALAPGETKSITIQPDLA